MNPEVGFEAAGLMYHLMGPTYFPTTPSTQAAVVRVGCWQDGIDGQFIQFTKYKWTILTCGLSV